MNASLPGRPRTPGLQGLDSRLHRRHAHISAAVAGW